MWAGGGEAPAEQIGVRGRSLPKKKEDSGAKPPEKNEVSGAKPP